MQASTFQTAILNALEESNDNLIISGVAGCGKTTTLKMICEQRSWMKKLYLAFSNEMTKSIAPKLEPFDTEVRTFHAYGKMALSNNYKFQKVDKWKYWDILKKDFEFDEAHFEMPISQVIGIIDIIRLWYSGDPVNSSLEYITPDLITKALDFKEIDHSEEWYSLHLLEFSALIKEVISYGLTVTNKIDFADMLFMPILNRCKFKRYPLILVDECQDLNNLMRSILVNGVLAGSRIIAVGDEYQSIMGFAGADLKSFQKVKEALNAEELPLNLCYRCGDSVIKDAQVYVPHIEGTGKESITKERVNMRSLMENAQPGDLIVCRRNAPLLSTAFQLLSIDKKVKIKGRDFSTILTKLIKDCMKKSENDYSLLIPILENFIREKISGAKRPEDRADFYYDAQNCIEVLAQKVKDYNELLDLIDSLFDDQTWDNVINLSSIHRSKGLEAERVWILLDRGNLAAPKQGQESNLSYVAITRAISQLAYVQFREEI